MLGQRGGDFDNADRQASPAGPSYDEGGFGGGGGDIEDDDIPF
jgi:hypothetical protein